MHFIALPFGKYIENVFWLIVEKGFSLFVGVMVGIYVARYLQPENFGLLNYSISFVSIFSVFATLGLDQIIVRELAQGRERDSLLGTAFILKLTGSCFLLVVMLIILMFFNHEPFTNTLIIIIAGAEIFKSFEVIN